MLVTCCLARQSVTLLAAVCGVVTCCLVRQTVTLLVAVCSDVSSGPAECDPAGGGGRRPASGAGERCGAAAARSLRIQGVWPLH